jgi:hypothetical protein
MNFVIIIINMPTWWVKISTYVFAIGDHIYTNQLKIVNTVQCWGTCSLYVTYLRYVSLLNNNI